MFSYLLNTWRPLIEVAILWLVFYRILLLFEGTRAIQLLKGIIVVLVIFFFVQKLELDTLSWILTKLFALSVIGFLIIFQPELRRALTRLGENYVLGIFLKEEQVIDEIVKSALTLSKNRRGGLIAIEKEVGLKPYIESGVPIDSKISNELINAIFMPNGPLHDGGVVIQNDRIAAAACLFPLTEDTHITKALGTRHRAAIGLSEETDAAVIIVSEETGVISIALEGKLEQNLNKEQLTQSLKNLYRPKEPRKHGTK